jgi:hypothetical protein
MLKNKVKNILDLYENMDMVMGSSGSGAGEKSPDATSVAQALSASSFTARTMKPRVTITGPGKRKLP